MSISKEQIAEDLKLEIANQTWKYAKTYSEKLPHEYILFDWNKDLFIKICKYVDKYAEDETFYGKPIRYGYIGGYKYWHYNEYNSHSILNRTRIDGYTPELKEEYLNLGYVKGVI